MPEYRRLWIPGGTFFFTVVTYKRRPILCRDESRAALRKAITDTRINYPFETIAWVLLPNHLHCIWKLPEGDSDYSTRWRLIKARFSRTFDAPLESPSGPNASRERHAERHIWQRRFWEHGIRNQDDLNRHIDYVHFNPVKHGLVEEPEQWPYSTYHGWVKVGVGVMEHAFAEQDIAEMECE